MSIQVYLLANNLNLRRAIAKQTNIILTYFITYNRIYDGIKEITNGFHFAFKTRDESNETRAKL